ncbi:DNA-binding MarR family transcriptional regulator [Chryseomicrobium aureum]|uniref:MarR family winged helix-turn-helix transcriptional regulator n=1 Tax=Chryseomicrobium aureum TaxID=1441723 RepID=UPI001956D7E2|nr:MarR family transcriptional regulator [Chryseomicrobium aureum]MBM7706838.1 DNA-binding MarR family transcriptional regulator [Chryseomicrobium aureum]
MIDVYKLVADLHKSIDEMNRLLVRDVANLVPFDLTPVQEAYVIFCNSHAPTTVTSLVEEFGVSKSAVSQMITKLENDGFVKREINPENKRERLIFPAAKAKKYQQGLDQLDKQMTEKYYVHLETQDIQQMYNAISKLNGVIRENR